MRSKIFSLVLSNGSLTIEETIPADEGVYQCVVHVTPHASHVTWTYLSRRSVLSLPSLQRFEHQPTNRKAYLGQFVAFRCILVSFCVCKLSCFRFNTKVSNSRFNVQLFQVFNLKNEIFRNFDLPQKLNGITTTDEFMSQVRTIFFFKINTIFSKQP